MVDTTEKIENSELVTNRDQLVVVDNIESLIKVIRGQQVIFDKDLAKLYGVETKYLNKQVKRNIERFPEDFMFQLTKEETFRLSHDRFLCIDDDVYHIGASIKDLGKKWFAFSKLDILSPDMLIEKIKSNN